MVSLIILILVLAYYHAKAAAHHTFIMGLYRQLCGRCDWWYEKGYKRMLYAGFIPIFGPFVCIAAHADIVRNITLEMSKPDAK